MPVGGTTSRSALPYHCVRVEDRLDPDREGGEIFIHGKGSKSDWTLGCVALEGDDVRELYDWIPVGTPVAILP
ncbi:MAG: L,D-transpeptidase [Fimbriimonadaceae bacterium]|nr:L,D-transpeptidase [Fimbriimonadaceae bacterium]